MRLHPEPSSATLNDDDSLAAFFRRRMEEYARRGSGADGEAEVDRGGDRSERDRADGSRRA